MSKWILKNLTIRKPFFDDENDKYVGSVEFKDGQNSFEFKLTDEQTKQMMLVVSDVVISCASELGENIAKSVGDYVSENTNKRL